MAEQKRDACSLPQTSPPEPSPAVGVVAASHPSGWWDPAPGPSWRSVIDYSIPLLPQPLGWEDGRGQGRKEADTLGS